MTKSNGTVRAPNINVVNVSEVTKASLVDSNHATPDAIGTIANLRSETKLFMEKALITKTEDRIYTENSTIVILALFL